MADVSPILSGLRLKCGRCGEGKLFRKYLVVADACDVCGRDLSEAETADGPAFFVGFGVLILLAPFLFILPIAPFGLWLKVFAFVLLIGTLVGLILLFLPLTKAVLLNLQLHHSAEEAVFSKVDRE
jgi:uncharacterized protein (DUF983 family)